MGLALAALGHAAVLWVLVTARPPKVLPPPERVSVTLSEEVGAISTSPEASANPAPDKGPQPGEPAPEPKPQVEPQPQFQSQSQPQPKPDPAPKPAPAPPPKANLAQRPAPAPQPKASLAPNPRPVPASAPKAAPTQAAAPKAAPARSSPVRAGTSSFNDAFASGIPGGSGKAKNPPAAEASAQQVSAWTSLIGSKVRGPWMSCPVSGLDVDKLRASVRFTLDPAGRIASIEDPVITGITDANRPQVRPFSDCAVRAIRLAAPFAGLPAEFHDQWKNRRLTFRKE
ncbi:MAG: hypothetical protein ACK4YM_05790 [Novosphingobium sp.]